MANELEHNQRLQLLEMAARLAGVGHWRFDLSTGEITCPPETYRIHGFPESGAAPTYDELLALYVPESAALLAQLVERALKSGQGYDLEATICRPDGTIRHVAAKAECVLSADCE